MLMEEERPLVHCAKMKTTAIAAVRFRPFLETVPASSCGFEKLFEGESEARPPGDFHRYLQSFQSDTTGCSSAASKFERLRPSEHPQVRSKKRPVRLKRRRVQLLKQRLAKATSPLGSVKQRRLRRRRAGTRLRLRCFMGSTSGGYILSVSE